MRRFRSVARNMATGAKGSLYSLGTGGAVGLLSGYAFSAIPMLGQAWWTFPVALALVGHFLKRRNPTVGGALLGVGGYWAYTGYMQTKAIPKAAANGFLDAGYLDAGRYLPGGSDAGNVSYNDNIGTDAAPGLGTAQAAMLLSPNSPNTMGYDDTAELLGEAYGLQD